MDELDDALANDFFGLDDDMLGSLMIDEIITEEFADYETTLIASARSVRMRERAKMIVRHRQENLSKILTELPDADESIHILGHNKFDAWCFVPRCLELMGGTADELYISTWLIAHPYVRELIEIIDAGKIRLGVSIITGLLFKRRKPESYAMVIEQMIGKKKGRFLQAKNHAKIILIANEVLNKYIVVETSANMGTNESMEQTAVYNGRTLYEFYRNEFDSIFDRDSQKELHW